MKKLLLLATGITLCLSAVEAQPYKQTGKENNLQLLFAPNSSSPVSLNGGIMYRKFLNPTMAARLGIWIGSDKSTSIINQEGDTANFAKEMTVSGEFFKTITVNTGLNPEAVMEEKSSSFSIRPGFEKHFEGTDRLSPYIGIEIMFTRSKSETTKDTLLMGNYSTGIYYDTTTTDIIVSAPWTTQTLTTKSGSKSFGVNLIAGMDFYFAKNLSLGAEFGIGFYSTKWDDVESDRVVITDSSPITGPDANFVSSTIGTHTSTVTDNNAEKRGKSSGFSPNVTARLKLGWLF